MKKLDEILTAAFELGTSDIHITVGAPPIMRLNGDLKQYGRDIMTPADTEEMAQSIIPKELFDQFQSEGELDFSYGIPKVSRFRVNAYHQRSCISLAIRVIPTEIPTFEQLSLPSVLKKIIGMPQGLVLVTGPTGSGKSTTLAAVINEMNNTVKKHIVTLEDPIEYLHRHQTCIIDQREVGFDTKSFSKGLRASLRQDPDVILLGEMRDLETISTAITAAETGHLVLATLHTTDAPSTIDRIIDVFPGEQQPQVRIQLASVLGAIVSQRLFPTTDRKSRVAAFEILMNNAAIKNLIRNEKIHQIHSAMQTSKAEGMQTLKYSIEELLKNKSISRETALPYLGEEL
jgi:twitching motility protein PilT